MSDTQQGMVDQGMGQSFTPMPLVGEDFSNAGADMPSPTSFGQYLGRDLLGTSKSLGLALLQGAEMLPQPAIEGQAYNPDPKALADAVQQQQAQRDQQIAQADDIASRFEGGILPRLGADAISGMLDPTNIAASMLPGIGEERAAALLGVDGASFLGRTTARAVSGASAGLAGQVPLELLRASEDPDWRAADILPDMTGGALLAGLAHVGLGALGDRLSDRFSPAPDTATDQAATRTALAQVLNGDPVEVQPLSPQLYGPRMTALAVEEANLRAQSEMLSAGRTEPLPGAQAAAETLARVQQVESQLGDMGELAPAEQRRALLQRRDELLAGARAIAVRSPHHYRHAGERCRPASGDCRRAAADARRPNAGPPAASARHARPGPTDGRWRRSAR